jgi:hypothetical protein
MELFSLPTVNIFKKRRSKKTSDPDPAAQKQYTQPKATSVSENAQAAQPKDTPVSENA